MTTEPELPPSTGIIAYDLTLPTAGSLVPKFVWLNPVERARAAAAAKREAEAREARIAEETLEAYNRWVRLRRLLRTAGNLVGVAVLDVHQPQPGYDEVVCSECATSDGDDTVAAPWECGTYKAVAFALEALDG